jgi:AsmA protein
MRWLLRVAGSLLLLALLAVAGLFLVPTERIANLAAGEFRKMTGRELTFEGSVRPTVWPHLGITAGTVRLANADWSEAGPMLEAEGLEIAVDLQALFGGAVRVTGITLQSPRLVLERAADGRANWDLGPGAAPAADGGGGGGAAPAAAASRPFAIDRAVIENGTVVWLDHASDRRIEIAALALDARVPDWEGSASVTASGQIEGREFSVEAGIGGFAAFVEGKVVPVTVAAALAGADIAFEGRAGAVPLAAAGRLEAALPDPPAILSLAGVEADLPEGLGRRSMAVAGQFTLTPEGSMHLRDGTIDLDGNSLAGDIDLLPGKTRPNVTARLVAGALDLSAWGGGSGAASAGGSGSGGGSAGWPAVAIDASGLGAFDGTVALAADSIDLGAVAFGRTQLNATIDAARAVIDLTEMSAYGGAVAGQVILNARKGFSTRLNLTLAGLALEPLMSALAGYDRLTGTGDLRFNVLASGGTLEALMRSLEGEGTLAFRQGEVRGLDLAGMIRTLDAGYVGEGSKTVFDSVTGSFSLTGGVLSNGDLAIDAPLVTAQGAGQVDIGGRTLDYRLTPLSLGGQTLDPDVQVPVLLSGPWEAPSVRLDLETLARRKFEAEAKELEAKAREELAKKAQEELGLEVLEGESLEDLARRAAQEALEQEAARALERLLGGEGGDLGGGSGE